MNLLPYDALLVDAGTGNLFSVHNALLALGFKIKVSSNPEDLRLRGRVILPGVGAFGSFMDGLRQRRLEEAILDVARRGDPLLGICVGMQALFDTSDELVLERDTPHAGLRLITGKVVRFPSNAGLKIPQTGWNQLQMTKSSPLFYSLPSGAYAYFNHSYYCVPASENDIITATDYGFPFASAVQHANIFGVQFHPEKSQKNGLAILANFFHC